MRYLIVRDVDIGYAIDSEKVQKVTTKILREGQVVESDEDFFVEMSKLKDDKGKPLFLSKVKEPKPSKSAIVSYSDKEGGEK